MKTPDATATPALLLDRRAFLRRAVLLGTAVSTAGLALNGCATTSARSSGKQAGSADTKADRKVETNAPQPHSGGRTSAPSGADPGANDEALNCMHTDGLAPAQVTVRESLKYTDATDNPDQDCTNCAHWMPAENGACGGCRVVPGPIHPDGWCTIWVAAK